MLSGGEQTKLALATTLAPIQEFSGLRFCIFYEPTYGVDLDSRHKLADAILLAPEAAGLNQLFLVSHDDAFDCTQSCLRSRPLAHASPSDCRSALMSIRKELFVGRDHSAQVRSRR
jgi:predicted ABC-type transport system involved in lysophospholipase L1 biosynthesis ATPase subunit